MNTGKTIFAQTMEFLPLHEFQKCVERYFGNYKVQKFSCLDQYLCMAFAQLTFRESLRDIIVCLQSCHSKLYHMGIRAPVSRSTLADANDSRDWRIYADFAQVLIHQARQLYLKEPFGIDLENTVYALDATTIDLCLALFPWARFRKNKGAIKLHTLLDLRGHIPSFIGITDGKVADVNILDILIPEAGSFYIMDRGYLDFARLYAMHLARATFITRIKSNTQYRRLYSRPVNQTTGLRCDQTIVLTGVQSSKDYPEQLRLIKFFDSETKKYFKFLTNNFEIDALTVAQLYKCRWKVELFFRWIKQHLRIKAFFGTSENAVKAQVWIAISVYVLVAIIKKRLALKPSLYTILQIFSVNIFEKTPVMQLLMENNETAIQLDNHNQLELFSL
ncbi:IS4 family transposase [bacterium]|nr:IS4 family transposase [bacterium]